MVNSGSFDSDGQGDRNAKVGCTQPHNASDSTQSSSPVTASAAAPCKTDFSQTADSDLPSVAHAIEPTPTKTEFNCDMPVENFTKLSSVGGALEESPHPTVSATTEDEKTSLCCSLPLDKVQGVLTPYHPKADDGTKVKPTRKLLCLYCDRSFVSANLRQKHVERVHSLRQNRRFSSRRQNQLTVTPCVYCDNINGTENTLKDLFQHLINEHSNRYFGCLPCQDRFLTSSLLADHNASNHPSAPQASETPASCNKTTLTAPKPDDKSEEEDAEEIPVKLTRSRMRPKPEDNKKTIIGNKKKSTKLKELRTKKLSVKSSRIALKRRESKRLQAIAKIAESQKKKRKPGAEKKQSNISKVEQINSTKSTEKAKSNPTCINPYPEFDHFYRVKKITDHSIDNLKISSLTFDDVFDKAFFNRIKCNIEENLLHHIDGKLFKNEESESRISNFEKVSNVPQEVQNSSSENYGCELSLNAVTPVASLSLNSQFGEDFESQIEYGSKPSKKKTQTRKDEIHYKYFTRRKYQASILEHKENRDLSKLDMWTQLVIKKRQQKMLDDKKSAKEILEYTTCDEYKNKMQREELNRILDRRGPFEDLKEEASKKAALDKLNSVSEDSISQESFTEVREILNEILNRVFAATEEVTVEVEATTDKAVTCISKKADLREIPGYLNLRRSSSLPSDGEIDKSDKIALICSSQETENFELPTNQVRGKNELIELTGEWARCRMYICAACGAKLPNMKYLLEHKSLYHQNVWVQHYEFVGNQSELYRHLSIPALGKVGAVEESVQCKVWRRSDARVCTKCGKQCNALGELHRHILECGGDWTWMLARKKCKYRPFGAKSRRKRRGLLHRFHHKQKTEPTEKKTYKKAFDGPRQRPSDADTIQRMLANLPAKRSTRKLISLQDGIYRARKKSQINNINQNKIKCGKVIYKSSTRKETTEKTINTTISVTSKKQKNKPSSNRRSLRSLNKVLASRILDTNSKLSVKRKIKVLNDQRRTRRSQLLLEEIKETVIEEDSVATPVSPLPAKTKAKPAKKENTDISEAEPATKRSSPRSSPKNVKKKMSVKKLLTGKINIKSFFPVKKKKNRKALAENQKPQDTKSEVENTDVKTRSKRKSKEIIDPEEEKKEEIVIPKVEVKKTKSETFSNLVRSLSFHKKKSTKTAAQDTNADAVLRVGNVKKQITVEENKDEQPPADDDKKSQQEKTNKKRKLKRSFRNVINRVKKLKIDTASKSPVQVEESQQNQKNFAGTFLEESKPEELASPAQPEQIVIPSISEAKESTADTTPAPIVMDFHERNENPPILETIFKLESNNEKSLQAKGELDFDTQPVNTSTIADSANKVDKMEKETLSAGSEAVIVYNEKTQPITIETSVKPKVVPLVSPNMKGKIRKPARGLNDCIAMLTSKLQQKIEEKPGDSIFSLPNIKEASPAKPECILRIPTFKSQKPYPEIEETALDLSTKSASNTDLAEKQNDVPDLAVNDNSSIAEATKTERALSIAKTVLLDKTQTEIVYNSVDQIIEDVVGNKILPTLSKWNSVDETIQQVVENHHNVALALPSRNTIDDIIDFVVEYGKDKGVVEKINESKANKTVRKIGCGRKPRKKKSVIEDAKLSENNDDLTPKVVAVIPKERLENTITMAVEKTVEENVDNTRSNIENTSVVSMKRSGSLKKKKNLKVTNNEDAPETKPKKSVTEKAKSKAESLDDIKNKDILEQIDAYPNEAFIDTSDTAVVKTSSITNKKATRKVGQVRNRSRSKKSSPTENKPLDKMLLETNVDTLSDVKEIDANPEMSQSVFVGTETTMTKGEEIKQLSNEDEPHLLENKVMTSQLKTNVLHSDSEDDIPLAVLVKPDELVKNKDEENKVEQDTDSRKINLASTCETVALSPNVSGTNTQLSSPVLANAEVTPKKVLKRRSKSIKKGKNSSDKSLIAETIPSVDHNTDVIPSSMLKGEENDSRGINEPANNSNGTKKRSKSLKNTQESDIVAIASLGSNGEEKTIEDLAVTEIKVGKKVQKKRSKSGKRKSEGLAKVEPCEKLDNVVKTNIDFNIELSKMPKSLNKNSEDSDDVQKIVENASDSDKTNPEALVIDDVTRAGENNQTMSDKRDAGDGLIEPLGNETQPTKSSENISNFRSVVANDNINPDLKTIENTTDLTTNTLNATELVETVKTPKRRGRPPKKKTVTPEANATISHPGDGSLLSEDTTIKSINELDTNFLDQTNVQPEILDKSALVETVAEIKEPGKKRSRSMKKKSVDNETEETTLVSSNSSLVKEHAGDECTTEDVGANLIEVTDAHTEPKVNVVKNILDSVEPTVEMKKPGKKTKSSKSENLNSEAKETLLISSRFLSDNFGMESNTEEDSIALMQHTDIHEDFVNNLYSAESVVEMKKPTKRRSRSKKKSLNGKSDETSLESSIISSLSEDIGIGSSNEEVEPQPEFAEPEVKALKARKRSKSVKRKNSRVVSPIDSLLSDSSLNSSEISEDFGEAQPIPETIVKKLPKRRSRSQKSPLEDDKSSNTFTDTPTLEVGGAVLDEKIVTPEITNKDIEEILPQNAKKKSKLPKNKPTPEVDFATTNASLSQTSDLSGDAVKNPENQIHELLQADADSSVPRNKTPKKAKVSKVRKSEASTNSAEILESNCVLPDHISEANDQIEVEFIELEGNNKRRSRSVRKKPIIDCTDSEEETSDNFRNDTESVEDQESENNTGKADPVLSTDNVSDCTEIKKANKRSKSLKDESVLNKNDQLTTPTDINGSIKIDDLREDFVEPKAKKKGVRGRPRSKSTLNPEDIFVDTQSLPVPNSNPKDTILSKFDVDNTLTLPFDEEVRAVSLGNNVKLKLKQKRGSLKNPRKKKNKGSKIILAQQEEKVGNIDSPQNKVLNEDENLEVVPAIAAVEVEKSKENIFTVGEMPTENCEPCTQSETEKTISADPTTDNTRDCAESSSRNSQEPPPIKIIINKQKTRRKSKSFKKVDLKGQNDLFEDFALVIKKPKRIVPIVAYTPIDTFPKDVYPSYIKKPIEEPLPAPKSAPEEVVEELTADLDASVEEMDMELDEIPITSNIIENLHFTAAPPVTDLFAKAEIESLAETLIAPKNILIVPEIQTPKKRGRPAKNKALKDIQIEELFQPPEKDLPLSVEVEEEFLYETNRRSTRKKSVGDIGVFVQNAEASSEKPKTKDKISLDASFELAEDINRFDTSDKLIDNANMNSSVEKIVESVANIFDFISGISNNDAERANTLEDPPIANKKPKKLKYNNKREVQADLEGDNIDFSELNDFVAKETETIELSSNGTKPKRNKRKKSNLLDIEPMEEPVNISSTLNPDPLFNKSNLLDIIPVEKPASISSTLNPDPSFNKEKDIDSIYAFTELDDLEIDLPIEIPRRMPKKQTKSFLEPTEHLNIDSLKDKLVVGTCGTGVEDVQKDSETNIDEEVVSKSILKRRSRSTRDIHNTNADNKEESINTVEIKENNIDIPENGRRKSIRSAKVKALEHIHDDALAELTESERNRDLDKDKIVPTEENSAVSDELSKKKCNKRQSKAPKLPENPELLIEGAENSTLLADFAETVEELRKNDPLELTKKEIDEPDKKKTNKKGSKGQKTQLLDDLEKLPDDEQKSQLPVNKNETVPTSSNESPKKKSIKKTSKAQKTQLLDELETLREDEQNKDETILTSPDKSPKKKPVKKPNKAQLVEGLEMLPEIQQDSELLVNKDEISTCPDESLKKKSAKKPSKAQKVPLVDGLEIQQDSELLVNKDEISTCPDESPKKKSAKKPSKVQKVPLVDGLEIQQDSELLVNKDEISTCSDESPKKKFAKKPSKVQKVPLVDGLEIQQDSELLVDIDEISTCPDESPKKKSAKKPSKAQKVNLVDGLETLPEIQQASELLVDKDKISTCPEESSKKKSAKKPNKAQKVLLLDDLEVLPEIQQDCQLPVNKDEISTCLDISSKRKSAKKPSKPQKAQLLDCLDTLPETEQNSQLLVNLAEDLTGLEDLENSIERELNTSQIEVKRRAKPTKNKLPKQTKDSTGILTEPSIETALKDDSLVDENNQELRRSRRGSRKIASYNENDLVDPLLDEIDGKRKNRRKDRTEEVEAESKVVKKAKEPEKKLNSDELFDLLKASSKDVCSSKAPNSFLGSLDESSKDFNDENFENVFENILEKSTILIQNTVDKSKDEKDIDKIYEFTESPESDDQMKDDFLLSECKRKIHKKLPRRNVSPPKLQPEDNSDSVLNSPALDTFSIPTTPDLQESSVDSKTKPTRVDKMDTLDKTNYCEICNKSFIRIENLIKHKRTLTHIQKLSEIEAKEAASKPKVDETQNESDSIIEITSDSSKVTSDLSKTDINISDILQESNKPSGAHSPVVHSSFANNHSLKLADIINDVLNKPVLEGDNEKHNSFSDIIMQNNTEVQPEYRRYKSLGERKSFDSEPTEPPIPITEPYVSKTTILEKQISLLENIIENQTGVNYIDDISMSSNNSLENNVLVRQSPSELSLKQDDSSNITYTRNNLLKPNTDDSFLKPSQYEEISEDSVNLRNYEDQKLRKTLNRDEELFLECCSLLKSGSEVSSYSNKKSHNKVFSTMGLKQCDEPEWLERKSLVQKPLYEVAPDYSDDNSRIPTPLGDSYDDDASNSNTISSNWNMNKKVPVFEDISQEKQDSANNSFTFEEVLNEYEEHDANNKNAISKFGGILSKTIDNEVDVTYKMIRTPLITENSEEDVSKRKQEELSDGSTSDNKKVITKGARKVFEGLKVSIPTEELNLEEVLNCSPKSKKMEIANIQSFVENTKLAEEAPSSQSKPSRTARKSKPVKNKSQFGSNLLFKMNKKKVLSPTSTKKKDDDIKTHDIYDFEETQDNTDVFTKPDFRTFRNMKSNELVPELEPESDTESRDYLDSFSVGAQSMTSSLSSSSSKKPKTQENITKKKCMIMGRIFKNAAKSKIEDIDEEIRDIPIIDNSELIESYVANCKKVIKNEEVAKPKLSEKEINQLFDQLLENKLDNLDTVHSDTKTTVKSKSDIRKTDNKKKLKAKNRKRPRTNSESTDDEFSLNKTTKKRAYRKNAKAEDNCINLEQELKECIGVASRKSQRKCTSGKQNVLVEYWSSDDSQFEALLESQRIESRQSVRIVEEDDNPAEAELPQIQESLPVEETELPKPVVSEPAEKPHKPKNADKKPQLKRKLSSERKKPNGAGNSKNIDTITSNRRKRAAANPLYHWSSSSEDESQDLIEVKPIRDELEDDEDRPVQHGWIVGDSPKKLVTMLAQAKGKKTDIDCVKEQGKKRTNAVS